jgi:hypothetical protein
MSALHSKIFLVKKMPAAELIEIALREDYSHLIQENRHSAEEWKTAQQMLDDPKEFFEDPLQAILGQVPAVSHFQFEFSPLAEKKKFMADLELFLNEVPGAATVSQSLLQIADEMFTNVVHHAADETSVTKLKTVFSVAYSKDEIVLASQDRAGRLNPRVVVQRIAECYARGISRSIRDSHSGNGAGIGCYLMYELAASFYLGVDAGHSTVVATKLPLHRSFKDLDLNFKNLHRIETE